MLGVSKKKTFRLSGWKLTLFYELSEYYFLVDRQSFIELRLASKLWNVNYEADDTRE